MEFEFDKEIDAILRRAQLGEDVSSSSAHIDADEIAAFAENALPERAKTRYTAHFADCTRCRQVLSNVITLNSEAAMETASSVVTVAATGEKTPWYRRFFAIPQLAYTMGGFVLLFSGFFAYVILQNTSGTQNSDVSRITETSAPAEKSAPSTANVNVSSVSNSSTTTTNSTVTTTANTTSNAAAPTNIPNLPSSNTTAVPTNPSDKSVAASETDNKLADAEPMATPAPKTELKTEKSDNQPLSKPAPSAAITQSNAAGASREQAERDRNNKNENAFSVDGQENRKDADDEVIQTRRVPQPAKKKSSEAGTTRNVGGKNFNNVGGIWFDTAYNKQKTKDVRRGTSDYQKLDSGLRSIADQLGGTVVVLWNGKAYRIQ